MLTKLICHDSFTNQESGELIVKVLTKSFKEN